MLQTKNVFGVVSVLSAKTENMDKFSCRVLKFQREGGNVKFELAVRDVAPLGEELLDRE